MAKKNPAMVCEDKIRWRGIKMEHLAFRHLLKVGYGKQKRDVRKHRQRPNKSNFGKIIHLCFMCLVIQYKSIKVYKQLFTTAYCLATYLVRHNEEVSIFLLSLEFLSGVAYCSTFSYIDATG